MRESELNNRYEYLAAKFKDGSISASETAEFMEWYNSDQDEPVWIPADFAKDEDWLKKEMFKSITRGRTLSRRKKLMRVTAIAAAIMVVFGVAYFSYFNPRPLEDKIVPGTNLAILTLTDGAEVILKNKDTTVVQPGGVIARIKGGQIVYQDQKSFGGAINTIETPMGGQYKVVLSDGSVVWLNAGSKLTFPASFSGSDQRRVTLAGEGYFEVSKDPKRVFVVNSAGQQVSVLGTHFNISCYPDEKAIRTTLLQGAVSIKPAGTEKASVLKPGEVSSLEAGKLTIAASDLEESVAWKDGYFLFRGDAIADIMKKLARWYDVKVDYPGAIPDISFFGKISRSRDIVSILNAIEQAEDVHFAIEGRVVSVTKKSKQPTL